MIKAIFFNFLIIGKIFTNVMASTEKFSEQEVEVIANICAEELPEKVLELEKNHISISDLLRVSPDPGFNAAKASNNKVRDYCVKMLGKEYGRASFKSTPQGAVIIIETDKQDYKTDVTLVFRTGKYRYVIKGDANKKCEGNLTVKKNKLTKVDSCDFN